jgi:diaminopimelate epimerase
MEDIGMLAFHRLHALGNHFLVLDETGQDFSRFKRPAVLKTLCNTRTGLGGDGVIFIMDPKDPKHHCRMQYFNADATEAEICGNALRAVAHLYRSHRLGLDPLVVETMAGPRQVTFEREADGAAFYRVEMGAATFDLTATGELLAESARKPLEWHGDRVTPEYVNVGNPHAVLFLTEPMSPDEMISMGAWLESHANHPRRINVEFVEVLSRSEVRVHVWERGCGMTQACGTGATAVTAAGVKTGRLDREVTVRMPGGNLQITMDGTGTLFMAGAVQEVAIGQMLPSFVHALLRAPA